ncbi:hypothetical protein BDY24DRAFT_444336 [Mrakia frigida]|uniref:uncharacterized protein n=1 Tax=Mrakia frigida TaxID=29902 RepID=UPI003FCBF781
MAANLFSSPLATGRSIAYISFLILNFVFLALLIEWLPWSGYGNDSFYTMIIIMFIALIALTVIVVPLFVFLLPICLKKPSIVKELRWDLGWLVSLVGLWLGGTIAWTKDSSILKDASCRGRYQGSIPRQLTRKGYCMRIDALIAFAWIDCLLLCAIFIETIVFGVVQSRRGNKAVWSKPALETSLFKDEASRPIVMEGA